MDVVSLYACHAANSFGKFTRVTNDKRAYASLLRNTFEYVKETVPTTLRVAEFNPEHPLSEMLREAASEEEGHEAIIEGDLKSLGFEMEDFEVSPFISHFTSLQMSNHASDYPVENLLGRMLILEGMHPNEMAIRKLSEHFRVKEDAAKAFYLHCELDQKHGDLAKSMAASEHVDNDKVILSSIKTCQIFSRHWEWMTRKWSTL